MMIRLGLCCLFRERPLRYRQLTAARLQKLPRAEQLLLISEVCLHNSQVLEQAITALTELQIHAYRIPSPIFPRLTHPQVGYHLTDLPDETEILTILASARRLSTEKNIRLSLHPDQFNVLSSPKQPVVENTIRELEYQGLVAELVGADVINIHGGGAYGDKRGALDRFQHNFKKLSERVQSRLTVENDDRVFTVTDLIPLCRKIGRPLVYDVHHHRCLPDTLSVEEATEQCLRLWDKARAEPFFHISSPAQGWQSGDPKPHADFIDVSDFPDTWRQLAATIDVEAKAKETAVLRLRNDLTEKKKGDDCPPLI